MKNILRGIPIELQTINNMTTCDNISFQRQKHKGFLEDFAPRISTVCSNDRAESKECFPKAPQPIDGLEGFIIFILREPRKKNLDTFHSTSWLIGIRMGVSKKNGFYPKSSHV